MNVPLAVNRRRGVTPRKHHRTRLDASQASSKRNTEKTEVGQGTERRKKMGPKTPTGAFINHHRCIGTKQECWWLKQFGCRKCKKRNPNQNNCSMAS